jgi:hypothetical protein
MWVANVTNLMYPNFVTYVMNKLSVTYTMRVFLANVSLTNLVDWLPGVMHADDICYMCHKCYQRSIVAKSEWVTYVTRSAFHTAAKKTTENEGRTCFLTLSYILNARHWCCVWCIKVGAQKTGCVLRHLQWRVIMQKMSMC